jgi:hypothetical protein
MSRWRDRCRAGLCIECGQPWQTVGVGGRTNVCSNCRVAYDRKAGGRILIGFTLFALGTVVQIVGLILR